MTTPTTSRRRFQAVAAATALALLATPHAAATRGPDEEIVADIATILVESGPDTAGAALSQLGTSAVPELFAALVEQRIASGDTVVRIDGFRKRAVTEALGRLWGSEVRAFLRTLPRGGPEVRVAVRLVAEHGARAEVALLARILEPPDDEHHVPKEHRLAYESALDRIVERDPDALFELPTACREGHASLIAPAVRVAGKAGGPPALRVLSDLLGRIPGAEALILGEMARLGPSVPHPVDLDVADEIRRQLDSGEPQIVIAAILAAHGLGDTGSVDRLIGLLDTPYGGGAKAHAALRDLTGKRFAADRYSWLEWYREEREWWKTEARSQLARIPHGDPAEVSGILQGLAGKRLYRHELAPGVTAALRRTEVDLVRLGCAVLSNLGSPLVVSDLIEVLEYPNPAVHEEARRALRSITGKDLGPDPVAWQELYR